MKITDLLKKNGIALNPKVESKEEAINKLVDLMKATGRLRDKEAYKNAVLERESLSTTGIGDNIAIPHAKTSAVKEAGLSAMVLTNGVDYDSLDGEPAKLFFMIAAPEGENNLHLDVLARLSMMLMDPDFKEQLINAKSVDEFLSLIDSKENDKLKAENDKEEAQKAQTNGYRVLAVTACPTGIAHTFMAAEALENKAKDMGISIKVETNGSSGAKNVLTDEEIANAECIIVAADKKVEMARFEGKKVIQTKVANGIHKTEELLNRATSGDAPIYHHDGGNDSENTLSDEKESIGRQIYKHLMNGVSHMLPFVIGGGILIALAFLLDDYNIDPANFGKNTPVAALISEGNVISDFDVITQPDHQRFMQTDLRGLHQGHRGVHNATYRRLIRHAHSQRTNKSNRFHLNRAHFNDLVTAHRLYLVNAHRLYLIVGNRNHLIVADGLSMVVYHIRGAVIQHLGVHVLLRVDVDLFFPCRIVKLQFIKPAALIGF